MTRRLPRIVTGPKSRDLFARISDADLTLPWLSHQTARVQDGDINANIRYLRDNMR